MKYITLIILVIMVCSQVANAKECMTSITRVHLYAKKSVRSSGNSLSGVNRVLKKSVDFTWMAKKTLPHAWPSLTSTQRKEFVGLLKKLMTISNSGTQSETLSKVSEPRLEWKSASTATIHTSIIDQTMETIIELILAKSKGGCWVVRDVIIDEVSMIENYREQFNVIIKKYGFNELLVRMRKQVKKKGSIDDA